MTERPGTDPALSTDLPVDDLRTDQARAGFDRLAGLARDVLDAPAGVVTVLDADQFRLVGCAGIPDPWATTRRTPSAHPVGRLLLERHDNLVIENSATDPRLGVGALPPGFDLIAYLGVPLLDQAGRVVGAVCVIDHQPRRWTDRDIRLLEDLAGLVTTEIELHRTVRDRDALTERLRSILDGLFIYVGLLDTEGRIEELNRAALQTGHLTMAEVVGRPFVEGPWWRRDPATRDAIAASVEQARHGTASRVQVGVPFGRQTFSLDLQFEPLRDQRGDVSGIVMSGFDITERVRYEQQLAERIRRQHREREGLGHLVRLADTLSRSATMLEITDVVARLAAPVVGGVFSNLAVVVEPGHLEVHHGPALDPDVRARWTRIRLDGTTALGQALTTRRTVVVRSLDEMRERFPSGVDDAETAGFRALVAVPLPGAEVAFGVCWDHEIIDQPGLQEILDTMAALVHGALGRAALYEAERSIAAELQRSLLPQRLPPVPGYDIGALYEPGTDGLHVGGDWYDVVAHRDGHLAVVGDVVGRGVPAATAMGRLRNAVAAFATTVDGLDELVDRLDTFAQEVSGARLTTAVLARLTSDGVVRVASAGHLPPLLRRADSSVEQLPDAGPPLGLPASRRRAIHELTLEPDDTLVLFTDGLVERRRESIDDGLARLADVLRTSPPVPAAELVTHLYARMGSPRGDDVAVLAVRRTAGTTPAAGGV